MWEFLRCIGEAVVAKGVRGLIGQVPFGAVAYDVAVDSLGRWKRAGEVRQQREMLQQAAAGAISEAREVAAQVAREVAIGETAEVQSLLADYLTQIPATLRRTLQRADDPAGRTVPAEFTLSTPEQIIALLPARPPRFRAGDRPLTGIPLELVELIGVGGFGEVWKARNPRFLNLAPVALKFCLDPAASELLRHEAVMLDRVMGQADRGIVTLRQVYLDSDPICLETEFISGGDLTTLIAGLKERSPAERVAEVIPLFRDLAETIGRMHRLDPPIVHRDLKPANVLVQRNPDGTIQLKVADFGIGGIAADQVLIAERLGTLSRGDYLMSSMHGSCTPLYASPQQRAGGPPDPRDDVHALGVIAYQMLTGDISRGAATDMAEDLREVGVPETLIGCVARCVSHRADRRPATATEIVNLIGTESIPAVPSRSPMVPTSPMVPMSPMLPMSPMVPMSPMTMTMGGMSMSMGPQGMSMSPLPPLQPLSPSDEEIDPQSG